MGRPGASGLGRLLPTQDPGPDSKAGGSCLPDPFPCRQQQLQMFMWKVSHLVICWVTPKGGSGVVKAAWPHSPRAAEGTSADTAPDTDRRGSEGERRLLSRWLFQENPGASSPRARSLPSPI